MRTGILATRQVFETEPRFRESLRRVHGEQAGAVFVKWFAGWQRPENLAWDLRSNLDRIVCPALIVQGEADEYALPQHARDIAACIPGTELLPVPGASHQLPQERAEEFNERLVGFL